MIENRDTSDDLRIRRSQTLYTRPGWTVAFFKVGRRCERALLSLAGRVRLGLLGPVGVEGRGACFHGCAPIDTEEAGLQSRNRRCDSCLACSRSYYAADAPGRFPSRD